METSIKNKFKAFTSIEQSKTLAEILPIESADGGWYGTTDANAPNTKFYLGTKYSKNAVFPAWSLVSLLDIFPKGEYKDIDLCCGGYEGDKYVSEWFCSYEQQNPPIIEVCHADNPIDACYEMIVKLKEKGLI